MKKTLAIFDFDGTITQTDSLNDLIIWKFGWWKFVGVMILLSPLIILYLLNIVDNDVPKERLFEIFFGGMNEIDFGRLSKQYSEEKLPKIIKNEASRKIEWHNERGHELIIITASMKEWIWPWAEENGFSDIFCTKPEIIDKKLTGRFAGSNCHGDEKLCRLKKSIPEYKNYEIYAYGDSKSDRELLEVADFRFYRNF